MSQALILACSELIVGEPAEPLLLGLKSGANFGSLCVTGQYMEQGSTASGCLLCAGQLHGGRALCAEQEAVANADWGGGVLYNDAMYEVLATACQGDTTEALRARSQHAFLEALKASRAFQLRYAGSTAGPRPPMRPPE